MRYKALLSAILLRGSQLAGQHFQWHTFCTERGLRTVYSRLQMRAHPLYRGTGRAGEQAMSLGLLGHTGYSHLNVRSEMRVDWRAQLAIYSPADRLQPHRYKADESYEVGADKAPVAGYLDIEGIIAVAKAQGVDAIHPGMPTLVYGEQVYN